MMERNRYHFAHNPDAKKYKLVDPVYQDGRDLETKFGFKPFYQRSVWPQTFHGAIPAAHAAAAVPPFGGEFSGSTLTIPT